jgi:hypothetical protein
VYDIDGDDRENVLKFCLGQSGISVSAQAKGVDGVGQSALDPLVRFVKYPIV